MPPLIRRTLLAAAIAFLSGGASRAVAEGAAAQGWREIKCDRYTKGWSEALTRRGTKGLGREFLDAHAAFLASGCTTKADVCPRSTEELDLANIMVVIAMNAGTASTFPPFACRK